MIATKFVICLLALVVVTMGFKLNEDDEGFSRREADEALEASEALEANADLSMNAGSADGFSSREADSDEPEEDDSKETKDIETNNSTLSRQASYPTACGGTGYDEPSHLARRIVKEAFDTYSSMAERRAAIWRKFNQANKSPQVLIVQTCLPWGHQILNIECVYYGGWNSIIYF